MYHNMRSRQEKITVYEYIRVFTGVKMAVQQRTNAIILEICDIKIGSGLKVDVMKKSTISQNLVRNLKLLRDRKFKTDLEMSRFLGVSQPTLSRYLAGKQVPSNDEIERIAEKFGLQGFELVAPDMKIIAREVRDPREAAKVLIEYFDEHGIDFKSLADKPDK